MQTDIQQHVARITDRLYRVMHLILDGIERDSAPMPKGPLVPIILTQDLAAPWRFANDEFRFWRLCVNRGCRRARRCCGEPRACMNRHLPQVPQKARDRVCALLRARRLSAVATLPCARQMGNLTATRVSTRPGG